MVPLREVLTERQETPHNNALVSGEIRIIANSHTTAGGAAIARSPNRGTSYQD